VISWFQSLLFTNATCSATAWDASERAKRDAWEADKTREVKELTIRGLEPEVQRLVQKHRGEMRDLGEVHREDLRRQNAELTQRHEVGAVHVLIQCLLASLRSSLPT
jgi:hypothetical protein